MIITPKYLKLCVSQLNETILFSSSGLSPNNINDCDLVLLTLYPDTKSNSPRQSKSAGTEDSGLVIYNIMSLAYNDNLNSVHPLLLHVIYDLP